MKMKIIRKYKFNKNYQKKVVGVCLMSLEKH